MAKRIEQEKQRFERQKKRLERTKARIQLLEQRQKTAERKKETRRKILVGALVLEEMRKDSAVEKSMMAKLDSYLTRTYDRELFGLSGGTGKKPKADNDA